MHIDETGFGVVVYRKVTKTYGRWSPTCPLDVDPWVQSLVRIWGATGFAAPKVTNKQSEWNRVISTHKTLFIDLWISQTLRSSYADVLDYEKFQQSIHVSSISRNTEERGARRIAVYMDASICQVKCHGPQAMRAVKTGALLKVSNFLIRAHKRSPFPRPLPLRLD